MCAGSVACSFDAREEAIDLAQYVLNKRIPLEICLLSNVHAGAARSLSEHPFKIGACHEYLVGTHIGPNPDIVRDASPVNRFQNR